MQRYRSCGEENSDRARFCQNCASPQTDGEPTTEVRKVVTIVFADVTGSTGLGERLDPEALRRVMGSYVDAMSAVIERRGGTVETFIVVDLGDVLGENGFNSTMAALLGHALCDLERFEEAEGDVTRSRELTAEDDFVSQAGIHSIAIDAAGHRDTARAALDCAFERFERKGIVRAAERVRARIAALEGA